MRAEVALLSIPQAFFMSYYVRKLSIFKYAEMSQVQVQKIGKKAQR